MGLLGANSHTLHRKAQKHFFSLTFSLAPGCLCFGVSICYACHIDKIQTFKQEERTSQRQDMAQQPFSYTQAKGGANFALLGVFLAVRGP